MSADTSVLVVKSPYGFTAEVVQAAENFHNGANEAGLKFLRERHLWLSTLPLAKQLAQVLADDEKIRYGGLQYDERVYIEIDANGNIFDLSKKGRRLPKRRRYG